MGTEVTTFSTGRQAEAAAAEYLKSKGYAVVLQNWRTRFCEIDIIAQKGGVVYFCEVKYRKSNRHGSGLEYITPKKQEQMRFAAEAWTHFFNWIGECRLAAIEVSGPNFEVTAFIDDL